MQSLFVLVDTVLNIYVYLLIASAIISWLIAFRVINTSNQLVYTIVDFLYRITEPVLRPIRRIIPSFGGIDISPVVVILVIFFLRNLIREYGLLL